MPTFLAEHYQQGTDEGVAWTAGRAESGARELTGEGTPVRYLTALLVPDDETCFILFEAPDAEAVRQATARGGLQVDRVSRALRHPGSVESAREAGADRDTQEAR